MIRTRRSWRRLGALAALLGLGWLAFGRLQAWNNVGQLRLAQQEIARGQLEPAYRRLAALSARPGALNGAADYWLGVCEALCNRPDAALRAFARLPQNYPFDSVGAYLAAKAHMTRGELHEAERRLEQALSRGGSDLERARDLLGEIYEIEVRFDDARALLRGYLKDVKDPIPILKKLSNLELDRLPYQGLQAALEKASQLAPEDDRVWLGKARLAIEAGRWNEAREWLNRCTAAGPDRPVWKAWIALAQGCGQPEEALDALRQLGPEQLEVEERLALWAWIIRLRADPQAEIRALEQALKVEPAATPLMERLAELSLQGGQSERVTGLRRRKADLERALKAYRDLLWRDEPLRSMADRHELARRAEAAGRTVETRRLCISGLSPPIRPTRGRKRTWRVWIVTAPTVSSRSRHLEEKWPSRPCDFKRAGRSLGTGEAVHNRSLLYRRCRGCRASFCL